MRLSFLLFRLVIGFVLVTGLLCPMHGAPITVGRYLMNSEGVLTATTPLYTAPPNLTKQTSLVVQVAPQYAIDFGIIPAADLKKWRAGQRARFLFRLTGITDTRYITLKAGSYHVVVRDLNGGVVVNGFAFKVRKFTGTAKDDGAVRFFVNSNKQSLPVPGNYWNGFAFKVPTDGKLWIDGVFGRGSDRRVRWEILTEPEYRKFISGGSHNALLTGTNPATLGFHFMAKPGRYYFLLINSGGTYSAFTVVRERYR